MKTLLLLTLSSLVLYSQALAPVAKQQFLDANGKPLAGGQLFTYAAGTNTPLVTYQDSIGSTNSNPVVLDAAGRANLWLGTSSYKFVLQNAQGVVQYTVDNVITPNVSTYLPLAGGTMVGSILVTNNAFDLGSNAAQWANLYVASTIKMGGTTVIDSARNVTANTVTTSAPPVPSGNGTINLGSSTAIWNNFYALVGNFGGTVGGSPTQGIASLYNSTNSTPFVLSGVSPGGGIAAGLAVGNVVGTGALYPVNNTTDLGLVGSPFRNLYVQNVIATTGTFTIQGATVSAPLIPSASATISLGSGSAIWNNFYSITGNFGGTVASVATQGIVSVYSASNGIPFVMAGVSPGGGISAGLAVGNVAGTSALYPVNATTDLGTGGAPFRKLYVTTIQAGGSNGVTGATCSSFVAGVCVAL